MDRYDLLCREIVEGCHWLVSKQKRTIDINGGDFLIQHRNTVFTHLHSRHLLNNVNRHFALVELDGGSMECDCVILDGQGPGCSPHHCGIQIVAFRLQIGYDPILSGPQSDFAPLFMVSHKRKTYNRVSYRKVPHHESAVPSDHSIRSVRPLGPSDGAGADDYNGHTDSRRFLTVFLIRRKHYRSIDESPLHVSAGSTESATAESAESPGLGIRIKRQKEKQ